MRRSKSSQAHSFQSFELTLSGVYLLTKDRSGDLAVPGIGVVIDQLGLTVTKPDGSVGAVLPWGTLRTLKATGRMEMPSSPSSVVIEALSNVKAHRFVVPTDDPDGLEGVIEEIANAKGSDNHEPRRRIGVRRLLRGHAEENTSGAG